MANLGIRDHDNARIATRVGFSQAAVATMMLLTLPGTLTIYYGEEIGMTNALIWPEDVQDPAEKRQPRIGMGRDPERTPMTWDCSDVAGFTRGKPWLPLGAGHWAVNVEFALRRAHQVLVDGQLRSLTTLGNLLRCERAASNERLVIFLNFGHSPVRVATEVGIVLAPTDSRRNTERVDTFIELRGSEGLIIMVAS
jgi:alpha-glucosidase